jgi:hypothetical protein
MSFVVVTEDVMIKKGTVVLQSCAVSLEALPGSSSEACATSCNDADEVMSIKVEDGTDTHSQPKEIPVGISFPAIKAEQDEVSYMSVCPLLDTFHSWPLWWKIRRGNKEDWCPWPPCQQTLCSVTVLCGCVWHHACSITASKQVCAGMMVYLSSGISCQIYLQRSDKIDIFSYDS